MSVMSAVVEVECLIVDMCSAVRCCTGRGLDSCLDICRDVRCCTDVSSAVAQPGDMFVVVSSADFVQVGDLCWCDSVKHYINMLLEVLYFNMEETKGQCWCDSVKHYINMMLLEVLYHNVEETKGECWCDSVKHYISHCGGD